MPGPRTELDSLIWTIDALLTPEECAAWIAWAEAKGFDEAPINTAHGPEMRKDTRNNSRVMVDLPELTSLLWERARPYVPADWGGRPVIGLNERVRFYRYDPGERFAPHADGAFRRANGERSELTFIVYLNEAFTGGQTAFYGSWRTVVDPPYVTTEPRTGQALLFHHPLWHEGLEVTAGRKYALRSDVMFAPRSAG